MCLVGPSSGFDRITNHPRSPGKALDLTIPPFLLGRADEVIEPSPTGDVGSPPVARNLVECRTPA